MAQQANNTVPWQRLSHFPSEPQADSQQATQHAHLMKSAQGCGVLVKFLDRFQSTNDKVI